MKSDNYFIMEFDLDSLHEWIDARFVWRAKELAEYVISEFEKVTRSSNADNVEVEYGLTENELEVGMIINMAIKLIYDKGYCVSSKTKYRILTNKNENCMLDQKWKYRLTMAIFRRDD